jgi:hypothetical protein
MITTIEIAALSVFALAAALILGYLWDNIVREFLLRVFLFTLVCLVGYAAFELAGLVIAVIVTTGLGALVGRREGSSEPGKRRGAIYVGILVIHPLFGAFYPSTQ